MNTPADELAAWPETLEAVAAATGFFRTVHVVRETPSTMDAARRLGLDPGDLVVAGRQTAGRGRRGRLWADTAADGVAMTIAMEMTSVERLSVAAGLAVADAASTFVRTPIGVKWPNDVLVGDRKLAGILIESADGVALVGIGVNVGQSSFPDQIAAAAISLRMVCDEEERVCPTRLDVMSAVLPALHRMIELDDEALARVFEARHAWTGRLVTLHDGATERTGFIDGFHPGRGLRWREPGSVESVWIPGAGARIVG